VDSELEGKVREREQELEQCSAENTRLIELLNQAAAEIVRYKEVSSPLACRKL
jgi:hypothetical protein